MLKAVVTALSLLNLLGGWDRTQGVTNAQRAVKESFEVIKKATVGSRGEQGGTAIDPLHLLRTLMVASEHWTQKSKQERLLQWMMGKNPPPRCVAVMEGSPSDRCMYHTVKPNSLCREMHRCLSASLSGCEEMRVGRTEFCRSHRCKSVIGTAQCAFERLDNSHFCTAHSCPCCINDTDCISNRIRIEGSSTCNRHRCCGEGRPFDSQRQICASPPLSPHAYCEAHLCVTCGITNSVNNLPRLYGSAFCMQHKCSTTQCNDIRRGDFKYCDRHLCRLCEADSDDPQPVDASAPESHICSAHRCASDDCRNPRLASTHDRSFAFCAEHTCRVCFLSGEACDRPVIDEYPRNACIDHPLCTHFTLQGWQCSALAILPNLIKCAKHSVDCDTEVAETKGHIADGQCCGIAKKSKKRCKSTGRSASGEPYWCHDHLDQAPILAVPVAAPAKEEIEEIDEYELLVEGCQPTAPLPLELLGIDVHR